MTDHTTEALTFESMRADIARLVDEAPEELENDDNLLDWGLDSMRIFGILMEWNKTGLRLNFADLAETPTLADWWQIVERQQRDLGSATGLQNNDGNE